ncbi:MAG: hypothetical protein Q8862_08770 [Bacteroidota bacterium]|nr:hypothetical protein [Bacteroidota bacterium]MDP4206371.1 hypothetical protein [Bacteroidota bacterium]
MNSTQNIRPPFLTAFCLLSFIGSGFSAIFQILVIIFHNKFMQFAHQYAFQSSTSQFSFFIATALFMVILLSFLGAFGMWKMMKIGFYIYIAAQFLLILLQSLNPSGITILNLSATIVFTAGYTYYFRRMH